MELVHGFRLSNLLELFVLFSGLLLGAGVVDVPFRLYGITKGVGRVAGVVGLGVLPGLLSGVNFNSPGWSTTRDNFLLF